MQPADFYKKLSGQTVQCQLCHHFCLIKNKQTGICRSRKNING
ncbi:AmmeMemoRadiSam system radical SAM enzyme, partial [Candidatus Falkowbacteria bacterium CG_4_9_14_3_um_filter_38_19]